MREFTKSPLPKNKGHSPLFSHPLFFPPGGYFFVPGAIFFFPWRPHFFLSVAVAFLRPPPRLAVQACRRLAVQSEKKDSFSAALLCIFRFINPAVPNRKHHLESCKSGGCRIHVMHSSCIHINVYKSEPIAEHELQ